MWPTFIFTGLLFGRWGVAVAVIQWAGYALSTGIGDCTGSCLPGSLGLALANAAAGALVHELVLGARLHRLIVEMARRLRPGRSV